MDDLIDLMIDNESPSDISDRIKDMLYAKTAEKVEAERPNVSAGLFGDEVEDEVDQEPQEEEPDGE
mgnify:FL=1|tara:strand:+ start:54 stop:251 length:198 start_codon:yes stop_codon:yes gene_type:complete